VRAPSGRGVPTDPTGALLGIQRLGTGLTPSFTLGCGTVGATSTSDNVDYHHILNIRRIVERLSPVPTLDSPVLVAP
jgi:acetaldehyde dehydrogenase (acetylating)